METNYVATGRDDNTQLEYGGLYVIYTHSTLGHHVYKSDTNLTDVLQLLLVICA